MRIDVGQPDPVVAAAQVLFPAHRRHLRCSPRFVTEQCEQTCFPQAPQEPAASRPPSTSIEPSDEPAPQSSQLIGCHAAWSTTGDEAAEIRGAEEPMFQKLWRDFCVPRAAATGAAGVGDGEASAGICSGCCWAE